MDVTDPRYDWSQVERHFIEQLRRERDEARATSARLLALLDPRNERALVERLFVTVGMRYVAHDVLAALRAEVAGGLRDGSISRCGREAE